MQPDFLKLFLSPADRAGFAEIDARSLLFAVMVPDKVTGVPVGEGVGFELLEPLPQPVI